MSHLLAPLLDLHGLVIYGLVAALAFGEAALFIGFVLPGETAVILGGVAASFGRVSLPVLILVVVAAAIGGDSVGYEVGRRLGPRLLTWPGLHRRRHALAWAQAFVRAQGGRAVFLGRFTAFLRAVAPGLAGLARMPYPRFVAFNAAGGLVWGAGFTVAGYVAGASYARVEKIAGRASLALLAAVVLILLAVYWHHRRKGAPQAGPDDPDIAAPSRP